MSHPLAGWLDAAAGTLLADGRTPGLVVAATDRAGLLLEAHYGWADLAARVPPGAGTLFQIGSITKVATAVLALRLYESGALDLHAPVRGYLGWLPEEPYARITTHQLLSHTSGLGSGCDISPGSPYLAVAAASPAVDPGDFHYSNAGFQVLGFVVEAVAGRPYAELLARDLLRPLGMTASAAVITDAIRRRLAVGYLQHPADRPFGAGDGLAAAPFFEYTAADGSMACTAADLAAFARMLLNRGAPALGAEAFKLLTTPVAATPDGESACYGVFASERYGYPDLNHSGGMVGYESMLCVDPGSGLGVVTMSNGIGNSTPLARALLAALRRDPHGEPPAPFAPAAAPLADYRNTYRGTAGERTVDLAGRRLSLDGAELTHIAEDSFALPGSPFAVRFGRQGGAVVELAHGPGHWVTSDYRGERDRPHPPAWDAYPGRYSSHNPFSPTFRIVIRNGELLRVSPSGREHRLAATPDPATFHVEGTREILSFDTPAGPCMLRAVVSGCPSYRAL